MVDRRRKEDHLTCSTLTEDGIKEGNVGGRQMKIKNRHEKQQ